MRFQRRRIRDPGCRDRRDRGGRGRGVPALAAPLAALCVSACSGARPAETPPRPATSERAAQPLAAVPRVRLFPPTGGAEAQVFSVDRDGSRRLIVHGLRVIERQDGSIEVADEFLPASRTAQALELPARLGGGFLFYVHASNATLIWRADTWTGRLLPLAQLDFEVERVVPGFDRLYLQPKRASDWVAIDPRSGKAVDLGSLPRSPTYGVMLIADSWFGAVEVPFRGVLVTFDAGASFRPLGFPAQGLELDGGLLSISTVDGRFTMDGAGNLRRADSVADETSSARVEREASAEPPGRIAPVGPLGRNPLELALLHGWPDSPTSALVAAGGAVGRISLTDGSVLALRERAYAGTGDCHGVPIGQGFGFVCGVGSEGTQIYEYRSPLELHKLLEFDDARYVAASENGALVIRGRCNDGSADESRGQPYCLRFSDGTLQEIYVRGDQGVERVIALRDKRAVVLIPPRLGAPGFMTIIEPGGAARKLELELPRTDAKTTALLNKGLWLDGFVESPPGTLAGWVAGSGPFVGVRVALDGKVSVGKEKSSVEHALFSGRRALVLGRAGLAYESIDGGFTWSDVDLPAEIDRGPDARPATAKVQGCSPVGCAFEGWMRVGYDGKGAATRAEAAVPSPTRMRSPGGGRWSMTCESTGEVSAPSISIPERLARLPERGRASAVTSADELTSTAWLPLLDVVPPDLAKEEIGFDAGTANDPVQAHGYAWGARGADWGRVGQFQLRMVDKFRVSGGVWSTAVTRSPWPDALSAAEAFGYEASGSPATWRVVSEVSGRAGVLIISARGSADLFLFEEGRSITRIPNVTRHGVAQVSGVVKSGGTWYLGSYSDPRHFRIYRIEGTQLDVVGEYRDIATHRALPATVVRSARGDSLAIWARGTSWFVYPIDAATGEVQAPVEVTPPELANMPRSCSSDEDGYALEGKLDLDPYADFVGAADGTSARSFEVRFLLTPSGLCVDAMAAQLDSAPPPRGLSKRPLANAADAGRPTVPLVVTDRRPGGRRWGFRCR